MGSDSCSSNGAKWIAKMMNYNGFRDEGRGVHHHHARQGSAGCEARPI